jgi:hypothetical protein
MMVNRNLTDLFEATLTRATHVACQVNSLESTKHLRSSGAELLRAVRCSLDEVIVLLDPEKSGKKAAPPGSEVD